MGLIPAILTLYIIMIPMNRVVEKEHAELFPFFRWTLFPSVPNASTSEYGLILHSINGYEVDGTQYLIPNDEIRDWKTLKLTAESCKKDVSCDSKVIDVIYPIVWRLADAEVAEFSIIEARIDLRDIQENIRDIVAKQANITDFFQPRTEIGRWNTSSGRIRVQEATSDGTGNQDAAIPLVLWFGSCCLFVGVV